MYSVQFQDKLEIIQQLKSGVTVMQFGIGKLTVHYIKDK